MTMDRARAVIRQFKSNCFIVHLLLHGLRVLSHANAKGKENVKTPKCRYCFVHCNYMARGP